MTYVIRWVAGEADVVGARAWRARLGLLRLLVVRAERSRRDGEVIHAYRWEVRGVACGVVDGRGEEARATACSTAEHVALLYSGRVEAEVERGIDALADRVEALVAAIGQAAEERAELAQRYGVEEGLRAAHARIIDAIGEHSAATDAEPESLAGAVDRLLASYAVTLEQRDDAIEGYRTAPGDRSDAAFRAGAPVSSSPKGARRLLWAVCDERGDVECSRRLVAPREIRFERLYVAAPRDWDRGAGADYSADLYDEVNAAIAAMALPVASDHVTFAVEELAVTTIARVPKGTGAPPEPLDDMMQEFERATRRLRAHTFRAGDEVAGSWHGRDVIRVSGLAREVRMTQIGGAS